MIIISTVFFHFQQLYLGTSCLSHGQLYVTCSCVGKPSSLFLLAKNKLTKNIVNSIGLRN